jgi:transposase-like protein
MGQVLHGSARTTAAIRRALQRSEEGVRALAKRYGISPTTVQKWRRRETTADRPTGPADPHSTTLSLEQEAMIVAFRRPTSALGRLLVCASAFDPGPDAILIASLPSAARSSGEGVGLAQGRRCDLPKDYKGLVPGAARVFEVDGVCPGVQ